MESAIILSTVTKIIRPVQSTGLLFLLEFISFYLSFFSVHQHKVHLASSRLKANPLWIIITISALAHICLQMSTKYSIFYFKA